MVLNDKGGVGGGGVNGPPQIKVWGCPPCSYATVMGIVVVQVVQWAWRRSSISISNVITVWPVL